MSKDNGGPAFPSEYSLPENQGISLRDYFAAKAMSALIMGSMADGSAFGEGNEHIAARMGYLVADAMLAERAK